MTNDTTSNTSAPPPAADPIISISGTVSAVGAEGAGVGSLRGVAPLPGGGGLYMGDRPMCTTEYPGTTPVHVSLHRDSTAPTIAPAEGSPEVISMDSSVSMEPSTSQSMTRGSLRRSIDTLKTVARSRRKAAVLLKGCVCMVK